MFKAKGTYIAFGSRDGVIGHFPTLAEAKRACAREELAPCGKWKMEEGRRDEASPWNVSYHAQGNGCTIVVGYDHPLAAKHTREDIDKALARFCWRESLR